MTGWIVAVVFIITTAVTGIVIVILLLRDRRGHHSTGTQKEYVISHDLAIVINIFLMGRGQVGAITIKSNEAYELTKTSG